MRATLWIPIGLSLLVSVGCGDAPAPKKQVAKGPAATQQKQVKPKTAPDDIAAPFTPFPIGDQPQQFGDPPTLPATTDFPVQGNVFDPLSFVGSRDFVVLHMDCEALSRSPLLSASEAEGGGDDTGMLGALQAEIPKWQWLWLYVGAPTASGSPPAVMRYVEFRSTDLRQAKLDELRNPEQAQSPIESVAVNDKEYERFTDRFGESLGFYAIGEQGLLEGSESSVRSAVESIGKPSSSRLGDLIRPRLGKGPVIAAFDLDEQRAVAEAMVTEMSEGLGMNGLDAIVRGAERGTLLMDPDGQQIVSLDIQATSEEAAKGIQSAAESIVNGTGAAPEGSQEFLRKLLANTAIRVNGSRVEIAVPRTQEWNQLASQRPPNQVKPDTRRVTPAELREWVIRAWVTPSELPGDMKDKMGNALLSWRVAVLPYGEQLRIFEKFHHEEPWDSPHNKAILNDEAVKEMGAYLRTEYSDEEGTTTWKMVPGWIGGVVLVEGGSGSAVPWTKPDMAPIDPDNPLAQFGKEPPGGYRVALYDGNVERLDAETLAKRIKPPMMHNSLISAMAIDRDGKLLATAGGKNDILIWDLAREKNVATLTGHSDAVLSLDFSPDGKTLASGSRDKTIKLWNVADGTAATLEGHTSDVHSVRFHPGGRGLASGSQDSTIRLWNRANGKSTATYDLKYQSVFAVVFSIDGRTLASATGGDNRVLIWNIASGSKVAELAGHDATVLAVAYSADGKQLASGDYRGLIKIWNVAKGEAAATLEGHTGAVNSLTFDRGGDRLMTASSDRTIRVWDLKSGQAEDKFNDSEAVNAIVLHPNGKALFTGGNSAKVNRWELKAP